MAIKQTEETFTVIFDDKVPGTARPQQQQVGYSMLAEFLKTSKRKYAIVNAKGETIYRKTFKG